ncbi:hypothetical protein [Nesterenkonia sp. HG001]|uniref:hypothetical protein n=1 Tax=Nesterenkonia sp. HG001 TaxID=2983207 RepID=UPI002AC4DC78|nr:hypothetical protein [Nesterenkonia sp. HG001]MDZ5078802.1 hypothetical protein [Nesterenkonia sp. HG001]
MRTRDFSACRAPQARTGALFLGCNEYRSPKAFAEQLITWAPLGRALKRAPGYLWHRSYYEFPLRIGLVVSFESRESLMEFAKMPEHQAIMHWLVGTSPETGTRSADPAKAPVVGGFIRILEAEDVGYANGTWRADSEELHMVERWQDQRPGDRRPGDLPDRLRATVTGVGQITALARALNPLRRRR